MKTFTIDDCNGRPVRREVQYELSVDSFRGMPGFALLLLAANPHLTAFEVWVILLREKSEANCCGRSMHWIRSRGQLFKLPGVSRSLDKCDRDGKYRRAVAIMRANPEESLRDLVKLLANSGISRGKDWVRQHRCDPETV